MLELSIKSHDKLQKVAHALSSKERLKIVELLSTKSLNVNQISEQLNIPLSTAASHMKVLEKSGLIITELRPATRGSMKVCTRNFDGIHIMLNDLKDKTDPYEAYELDMPIGQYTDFSVSPTCGIADEEVNIIPEDVPAHFYSPLRSEAQLYGREKGTLNINFHLSFHLEQR